MQNSFKITKAVTVMIFHRYCNSLLVSQIRNAWELAHLRRICERQNLKAQRATDAKHLDFGVTISYISARFLRMTEFRRNS